MDSKAIDRFDKKIEKLPESGCWIWMGATTGKSGYGHLTYKRQSMSAHRASWEMNFGHVPPNKYILHKCDVKLCVNPTHLFLGDHKANMQDMLKKNRSNKGEKNGASKLKPETIAKIREMRRNGMSYKGIGNIFSVCGNAISDICKNRTWTHI